MDSAYPRWDISRVKVTAARSADCPCGASSLTRGDTGLCERCTAKLPQQQWAAAEWRQKCLDPVGWRRSAPLAKDACALCGETYEGLLANHRAFECQRKTNVCHVCGRRYIDPWDMTRHLKDSHGVAADR